jgi:2-polyprenyl-3-methyl-5-hydroxy-6-metoxy-1,4-benzoquinol methylase
MMQDKMAGMGDQSTKMMAMREKMMADMKANDARMDLKVAAMNAAEGTAKTDAIAAVINEMVSQQKQMMTNMDTMCKQMMEHMAHPDVPMKGMDMGKPSAGSPK